MQKRYIYMILFIAVIITTTVSCSTKPKIEYITEYKNVKHNILIVNKQKLDELEQIKFNVVNGKITIDDAEYKKLLVNIILLKDYIEKLKITIDYYESQIKLNN